MNCSNFIIGGELNTSFQRTPSNCIHVIGHVLLNNGLFEHMLDYYGMQNGVNLSFL